MIQGAVVRNVHLGEIPITVSAKCWTILGVMARSDQIGYKSTFEVVKSLTIPGAVMRVDPLDPLRSGRKRVIEETEEMLGLVERTLDHGTSANRHAAHGKKMSNPGKGAPESKTKHAGLMGLIGRGFVEMMSHIGIGVAIGGEVGAMKDREMIGEEVDVNLSMEPAFTALDGMFK